MSNKTNSTSGGIGFAGALTLMFIAFKLCKIINWSWVWVLSPLWISISITCLILIIMFILSKRR